MLGCNSGCFSSPLLLPALACMCEEGALQNVAWGQHQAASTTASVPPCRQRKAMQKLHAGVQEADTNQDGMISMTDLIVCDCSGCTNKGTATRMTPALGETGPRGRPTPLGTGPLLAGLRGLQTHRAADCYQLHGCCCGHKSWHQHCLRELCDWAAHVHARFDPL